MSFLGLNTGNNLSLYAVPAAWVLSIAPHFYAVYLFNSEKAPGTSRWDNRSPKGNLGVTKDAKLSPAVAEKFQRAEAANENGFINLPFFGVAILAGNFARLPASTLNTYAGAYLASRVVYNLLYINCTTRSLSSARSLTFLAGIASCFTLLIKAGNVLSKGYIALP